MREEVPMVRPEVQCPYRRPNYYQISSNFKTAVHCVNEFSDHLICKKHM